VNRNQGKLFEAFSAIRQGEFERAFELADSQVKIAPDNFWGWYFAAVSLGFLDRRDLFGHYLDRASLLNAKSPFIIYLRAYAHLQKNDLESALMKWTALIDLEEGWLARDLIEKARKGINLVEKAEQSEISFFIVLPDFVDGIGRSEHQLISEPLNDEPDHHKEPALEMSRKPVKSENEANHFQNLPKKKFSFFRYVYYILTLVVLSGFFFILKDPIIQYINSKDDSSRLAWKNFKIDEWAALVNAQKKDAIKYVYQSKDKLIEDFEQAKVKLSDNKYNQARFLLQRIMYSNADFKTKEKSKIFLSFIPEPDYQDFSDPVFPDKLLEAPEFYADCLVLWQGSVLKIRDVDNGREVSLLIKDASSDYLVDAFLQSKESKSNWLPFSDFQKKKELAEKKPQAIVYGKFKGVIGNQKKIYLELVQLWM
jgi:hypothetical protein